MKAILYTRVSGDDQAKHGVSLPAQEAKCRAYCALHGLDVIDHLHDDGITAKNINGRPAFKDALARLKAKTADALVFCKLDRVVRSVPDADMLVKLAEAQGWKLHSIDEKIDTGSAVGRFVVNVIAALGQMERELIGERTAAALAYKRSKNERISRHAPYGFRFVGSRVCQDPVEGSIIAALEEYGRGDASYVARCLNGREFTFRGRPWTAALVEKVRLAEQTRRDARGA